MLPQFEAIHRSDIAKDVPLTYLQPPLQLECAEVQTVKRRLSLTTFPVHLGAGSIIPLFSITEIIFSQEPESNINDAETSKRHV